MLKTLITSAALVVSLGCGFAQSYTVNLSPTGGAATGSGSGTLSLSGTTLTFNNLTYSGLSGNSVNAHIHGPLPATGVLFALGGLTTFGSTSGTINGDVTGLTPAHILDLNAGKWYVNIHSTTFSGGEISGIIALVPEPGTMALLGLGAGALMLRRRPR